MNTQNGKRSFWGKKTNLEIQLQDKLLEYSKLISLPQSQLGSKQCVYVNNFHLQCTTDYIWTKAIFSSKWDQTLNIIFIIYVGH